MHRRPIGTALIVACVAGTMLCMQAMCAVAADEGKSGKTRIYYVAADEVNWDYAPSGRDEAMGMDFDAVAKGYSESGPHQIGRINKKAIYREYDDATFTKLKARPLEDAYLGGPLRMRKQMGFVRTRPSTTSPVSKTPPERSWRSTAAPVKAGSYFPLTRSTGRFCRRKAVPTRPRFVLPVSSTLAIGRNLRNFSPQRPLRVCLFITLAKTMHKLSFPQTSLDNLLRRQEMGTRTRWRCLCGLPSLGNDGPPSV